MRFDFYRGELLLVDKPLTWSSFQAVNKIRHAVKRHPSMEVNGVRVNAKVGHAGTLDPLATGLLLVCTGKKTKTIDSLMGLEKEYTGTIVLGATTASYDLEKPVDRTFPTDHLTADIIRNAAAKFTGTILQAPPAFSAVMIEGKRAYELARSGEMPEMKQRAVTITEFELTRIAIPEVDFRVVCSKGTYIRSLARDFGEACGSGGHLSALCRTRIGDFRLADAASPLAICEAIQADQL